MGQIAHALIVPDSWVDSELEDEGVMITVQGQGVKITLMGDPQGPYVLFTPGEWTEIVAMVAAEQERLRTLPRVEEK